jgi:hypothetical protein
VLALTLGVVYLLERRAHYSFKRLRAPTSGMGEPSSRRQVVQNSLS